MKLRIFFGQPGYDSQEQIRNTVYACVNVKAGAGRGPLAPREHVPCEICSSFELSTLKRDSEKYYSFREKEKAFFPLYHIAINLDRPA